MEIMVPMVVETRVANLWDAHNVISRVYHAEPKDRLLLRVAHDLPVDGAIIEIGTGSGHSTCALALGAKLAGKGKVYAIDWDIGQIASQNLLVEAYRRFDGAARWALLIQNVVYCGVHDWVRFIVCDSAEAWEWISLPCRLLFIDGAHSGEYVTKDMLRYGEFVVPGGMMFVHDYYLRGATEDAGLIAYNDAIREYLRDSSVWTEFIEYDRDLAGPRTLLCSVRKRLTDLGES